MKLKLLSTTKHHEALTLEKLKEYGLKGAPQGGLILKADLVEYITNNF